MAEDDARKDVSAVDAFICAARAECEKRYADGASHPAYLINLAAQIQHNLQYQHDWTSLRLQTHSESSDGSKQVLLPRPMVSGIPPQRLYVHPDDQVEFLRAQKEKKKLDQKGEADDVEDGEMVRREWVLPSHLREKWSLRRFAEVFDAIGRDPPSLDPNENSPNQSKRDLKRVLLATVHDDSTIVYYIMHDGIVKPRQN